jgi:hypothetical protein
MKLMQLRGWRDETDGKRVPGTPGELHVYGNITIRVDRKHIKMFCGVMKAVNCNENSKLVRESLICKHCRECQLTDGLRRCVCVCVCVCVCSTAPSGMKHS